jgi:ABC-type multidrug transport system fused ATPase/permease subunit
LTVALVWETRAEGPLVFHYQADSYAHQNLDSIAAAYQQALADLTDFIGNAAPPLSQIHVYLCQFSSDAVGSTNGQSEAGAAEIWSTLNSESPASPEQELAQLLLTTVYGPAEGSARFWYDGLAGYLAGKNGSSPHHAAAPERVTELFEGGQLPPLIDLIRIYGIRQSALGISVATAFVRFLIEEQKPERFRRFLGGLRDAEHTEAFRRVYGAPVQSLEQAWYRKMETTSAGGTTKVTDAVKQLIPYMRLYKRQLLGILLSILVTISFALFMPQSIRFLVNTILARNPLPFAVPTIGDAGHRLAVGPEQTHALLVLLGAMIVMFILSAISNTRRSYLVTSMSEGVNFDLRMRFFDQLQELPIDFHRRMPNQDLTQRYWADISTIAQALTLGIVPMAQSFLMMLLFGLVLIWLNWKLALIALAGLPIFAISFQRMRTRTRETARERARRTSEVSQSLIESLNAQEKIRLYGLRDYLTERLVYRLDLLRALVIRITLMASASTSTSVLITNGAQVAVLILGGLLVIDSQGRELSTGDLMAFYIMLLQLYAPAGIFTNAMQFVNNATTSLERVNFILNRAPERDPPNAVEIGPLQNAIRFDLVAYGKTKGKDLIRELSLEIKAGTKVGFVGPPGAGKASLMELLPRFYELDGGSMSWDGVDLRAIKLASLRQQLVVVSSETYIFRTTVYDNIRYGRIDASDEETIAAARKAGLHEFILSLPGGYDTQINERDPSFGMVQRQRMAVARALLQTGSVILMDDALSALDTPGQRELEDALRGGPEGSKTLIRVAQRVGAVLDADQIFVMDGGELVEQGTADELRDKGGLFAQLLKDELGAGAVSGAFQAMRRLAKQAPFSELSEQVREEVARLMLYAERAPGDVICRQGNVGDELFVIGRGEVEVVLEEEGQELILNFLHEGEYFGEISFLRRVPRTATVRARTPTELHILRRQDFDQLLEKLGEDVTIHLDRTAQQRLDQTKAALAAAEASPP